MMSRSVSRQSRSDHLIEATIDVLALKGYSRLTISDVAKIAGTSHGSVFLHFRSKEELLKATLMSLEDRYNAVMKRELEKAEGNPRKIILAAIETDLSLELATPRLVRAWASYRSEAREVYESLCQANDDNDFDILQNAFTALGGENTEIRARLLRATLDGLLRQLLLGRTDLDGARRFALASLKVILPEYFGPTG